MFSDLFTMGGLAGGSKSMPTSSTATGGNIGTVNFGGSGVPVSTLLMFGGAALAAWYFFRK